MDIPKYTENEERLIRENRDLREKVKSQEEEILSCITDTGVWIKKLEEKSRLATELVDELESAKAQLAKKCQTVTIAEGTIQEQRRRIEGLENDNRIYSREREKARATTARFAEAITTLRRDGDAETMVARLREILLHNKLLSNPYQDTKNNATSE